eukprot:TRINITY_DN1238_c0_g1_i1.p1 TRINITY_DN1238_c0_g1~~TRINITY_DN1238_c0_g1_i1.p1  ORF type:complete len:559 (+),score=173.09 TRINITY_DN1238_c0_g1_i1:23-1699(+)
MSIDARKNLFERCIKLVEASNEASVVISFLDLMVRIVGNIVLNPQNESYRKLLTEKDMYQTKIGCVKAVLAFLSSLGFKRQSLNEKVVQMMPKLIEDDVLFLQACVEIMKSCLTRLKTPKQEAPSVMKDDSDDALSSVDFSTVLSSAAYSSSSSSTSTSISSFSTSTISFSSSSTSTASLASSSSSPAFSSSGSSTSLFSSSFSPLSSASTFSSSSSSVFATISSSSSIFSTAPSPSFLTSEEEADFLMAKKLQEEQERALRQDRERRSAEEERLSLEFVNKLSVDMKQDRLKQNQEEEKKSLEFAKQLQQTMDEEEKQKKLLQKEKDEQTVRLLLEQDEKQGRRLTLEQYNVKCLGSSYKVDQKFKCPVCFDEYDITKVLVLECKHVTCVNDMKQHLETNIQNGNTAKLKCIACSHLLKPAEIQYVVSKKMFEKYLDFSTDAHLRSDPNCRWCPKKGCSTPMIGDKQHPMMRCPKCKFQFCFNCQTDEWHSGTTCEKFQEWKKLNNQTEAKFAEYVASNTKPCPKCAVRIEKNGGCDHMHCSRCNYDFWYSTGQPYS